MSMKNLERLKRRVFFIFSTWFLLLMATSLDAYKSTIGLQTKLDLCFQFLLICFWGFATYLIYKFIKTLRQLKLNYRDFFLGEWEKSQIRNAYMFSYLILLPLIWLMRATDGLYLTSNDSYVILFSVITAGPLLIYAIIDKNYG